MPSLEENNSKCQKRSLPLTSFLSPNMAPDQGAHQLSDSPLSRKNRRVLEQTGGAGIFTNSNSSNISRNLHFTHFNDLLRLDPPPIPSILLRGAGRKDIGPGKVKILLRVAGPQVDAGTSWMTIDQRRKQVNLQNPSMISHGARSHSALPLAPKMFQFDSIFSPNTTQSEICSSTLVDLIQAVINGVDGCLISYGHSKLGKTYSVVGCDTSVNHAGLIPSAIAWLFRLVEEERQRSGAHYKIRISAVEVSGARETVTDLLADLAFDQKQVSGGYACDDPAYSSPLLNPNQLPASNVEEAAQLLDSCLAARRQSGATSGSHMFFTLHLYQYRLDKSGPGVSDNHSHLRLIDLGSQAGELPLSGGLGNVILALINGQKSVPCKESKITQLLKDALCNVSGHTALLCHVSCASDKYTETLSVIQMASRVHRMRRKRIKTGVGYGIGDSSRLTSSTSSDPSSSEVSSATTVIFCGNRQHPDSEGDSRKTSWMINRIQTNPNLKLVRVPVDAHGYPLANAKGAPQSMLSLTTHGSPVRRPVADKYPVSDFIEPVLRPRPVLNPIMEDRLVSSPGHQSPKRVPASTYLPPGENNRIPTGNSDIGRENLELRPRSLNITRQTPTKRPPLLGKATWTEGTIDPSKRDMIQRWVELQSPEEEKSNDVLDTFLHSDQKGKEHTRFADSSVSVCDAAQQVTQLQILHETHSICADTPEPTRTNDYGISQQDLDDLDAIGTLASHLSSQLDLLSVEQAESLCDEQDQTSHDIPSPMKPLDLGVATVWDKPRTGTFPRNKQHLSEALSHSNSLKLKPGPAPPARSSSVPRQMREQMSLRNSGSKSVRSRSVKVCRSAALPAYHNGSLTGFIAPSPDFSQDSGHDSSGFSVASTNQKFGRNAQQAGVASVSSSSKRSPSQSSSGLGSDGNSSVGSRVGKPVASVVSDVGGLVYSSSSPNPGSPRRMALQNIDEEERSKQTKTVDQITVLRRQQCHLKVELLATQALLGIYPLGVPENGEPNFFPSDPRYLRVLSQTTKNLDLIVSMLKSQIMLVTCL